MIRAKKRQTPTERDARRKRLGQRRFHDLVMNLAGLMRLTFEAGETGSLFGLEGPLRAAIRADLCRAEWGWRDADALARDLLDEAFKAIRATRPAWNEGQLEWTVHAGTLIERTRCVRCHKPLPEGHFKFCGAVCQSAHWQQVSRMKDASEDAATLMAVRSI